MALTTQFTDDFNHAITAPTFYPNVFSTPTSVGSPVFQSQPASLEVISAGSNIGVRKNITGSPVMPWTAFAWQADANASVTSAATIVALHPAVGNEFRIAIGTDGVIHAQFTAGSVVNGSTYATYGGAGTWLWIEAKADFNGTTYTGYWRINDVDQTNATKSGETASSCDYMQLISYSGGGNLTWHAGNWNGGYADNSTDWMGTPSTSTPQLLVPVRRRGG